jgi:hypothetical protein
MSRRVILLLAMIIPSACQQQDGSDQALRDAKQTVEIEQLKVRVAKLEQAKQQTVEVGSNTPARSTGASARYQLLGLGGDNPPTHSTMAGCLAAKRSIQEDRKNAEYMTIHPELSCIPVGT